MQEEELIQKLLLCKWVICDVDGVLTDGKMIYTENGDEIKQFHVRDGIGANLLKEQGIKLGIISSGYSEKSIKKRFSRQGFEFISVECRPKIIRFEEFLEKFNVRCNEVMYIGDDINDIEVMRKCLVSICPKDAHSSILGFSDWVLKTKGGEGCLREVADYLIPLLKG
jgi:3-deoxy-D-manno-octulosonate 8-phosphate phosphatase (KDO 8-P phosphatase)